MIAPSPKKSKRLGQHFLIEQQYLARIGEQLAIQPNEHIIEIGAGDGALTTLLAQSGVRVTALEFDGRRIPLLRKRFAPYRNLRVIEGDALSISCSQLLNWEPEDIGLEHMGKQCANASARMVGNLPYNIASQIILRFAPCAQIEQLTFMLQRELAQRLTAPPDCGDYGRFTLSVKLWRDAQMHFDIPPGAFDPPPKVTSSLVTLGPLRPLCANRDERAAFDRLVQAAFAQRRKQLRNSLAGVINKAQISAKGINPHARAENLRVEDFLCLARAMCAHMHNGSLKKPLANHSSDLDDVPKSRRKEEA